jgi:negative regulator of sigma-B (phosphoserine phosphatase)
MEALSESQLEWGVASRPLLGEASSGDQPLAQAFPGGLVFAVVDALGHGDPAASTAKICAAALGRHAGEPVERMIAWCHEALVGTRGAAVSVASYDAARSELTWTGVGNVESVFWASARSAPTAPRHLVGRNGVVGMRLPPVRVTTIPVSSGDTLVFATDGIGAGFVTAVRPAEPPQRIADTVLAGYGKETDDALVLVVRFGGRSR